MTETIAIVNEKGGTGKTTTAVNLSAALGELGRKVLLVDLDGQAASSRWLGVEDDTRFADALWSGEAFEPIVEVVPGVSLAPGSGKLDSVAHDLRPTQGGQLRKVLQQFSGFDHIIIDCPPSLGNRLIGNALLAATHAIVPVEASILALDGLKILLTTFQDIRDGFGHDIVLRGVLACRYDHRTRLSRLVLAELNRALPGRVFRTVIRENIRMRECPGSGQSILTYAPDSHAAEDYRLLAKEFLVGMAEEAQPRADGTLPETELSDEERQAIRDIRGQVKAMLQATEPRSARPSADASRAAPGGAAPEGAAAGPDEDEIDALAESVTIEGPAPLGPLPLPQAVPEPAGESVAPPSEAPAPDAPAWGLPTREEAADAPAALDAAPEPAVEPAQPEPLAVSEIEAPAAREVEPAAMSEAEPPALSEVEAPAPSEVELPVGSEIEPLAVSHEQPNAPEPLGVSEVEPPVVSELEPPVVNEVEPTPASRDFGERNRTDFGERRRSNETMPDLLSREEPPADAAAPPPTESPAQKDSMAALRAVLESIKKQAESTEQQPEAKKGPVWRRLFNKRSA